MRNFSLYPSGAPVVVGGGGAPVGFISSEIFPDMTSLIAVGVVDNRALALVFAGPSGAAPVVATYDAGNDLWLATYGENYVPQDAPYDDLSAISAAFPAGAWPNLRGFILGVDKSIEVKNNGTIWSLA